jgi:NAD-dependent SIR2 family protein deacetylase
MGQPALPAGGGSAPGHRVVRRNALSHGGDRGRLREADLFVSIGTSGAVYPAAGFVRAAREVGARCLELNLERSEGSAWFHETRLGPAGQVVPAWVEELLG